jgi:hypothetical protein
LGLRRPEPLPLGAARTQQRSQGRKGPLSRRFLLQKHSGTGFGSTTSNFDVRACWVAPLVARFRGRLVT